MTQTAAESKSDGMSEKTESVTAGTVLRFLIGRRNAINSLLNCRSTVWIGLLFVISADFAREYDGESLLHEPWHLLIPLGASLVTSLLLFSLLAFVCRLGGAFSGSFLQGYRHFLGLYWMTAPLAWFYAIPIERFLSPADSVRVNLMFLAFVSFWRVALMTRIVSVVFKCNIIVALVLVMLFADTVALSILYLTPMPIFDIMGGIRLTDSEQVIQSAHLTVGLVGFLTSPIWLLGGIVVLVKSLAGKSPSCTWHWNGSEEVRVAKSIWLVAVGCIALGAALLPFTQPEQYNRWQVRHAFSQGRIDDGIRYMVERQRSDFPPHWDPPPQIGYGEENPPLIDILDRIELSETKGWVREIFVDKLRFQSGRDHSIYFWDSLQLTRMPDERLSRYIGLVKSLPDGDMIAWSHNLELRDIKRNEYDRLAPERRELLQQIFVMADRYEAKRKRDRGIVSDPTESAAPAPEDDRAAPADQPPQSDVR